MNKAEFNAKVNELLEKAKEISYDDYHTGMRVTEEFKRFAHDAAHVDYLNQYTTEHVGSIQADFSNMRKYKADKTKRQHYNSAMSGLLSDIESMLHNTAPE